MKINNTNKLCNKQTCTCIVLIQGSKKSLMKFAAVSVSPKTLKRVGLPNILFNIDNNGSMFTSLFLNSLYKTQGKCYKGIYVRSSYWKL